MQNIVTAVWVFTSESPKKKTLLTFNSFCLYHSAFSSLSVHRRYSNALFLISFAVSASTVIFSFSYFYLSAVSRLSNYNHLSLPLLINNTIFTTILLLTSYLYGCYKRLFAFYQLHCFVTVLSSKCTLSSSSFPLFLSFLVFIFVLLICTPIISKNFNCMKRQQKQKEKKKKDDNNLCFFYLLFCNIFSPLQTKVLLLFFFFFWPQFCSPFLPLFIFCMVIYTAKMFPAA